jgi:tetratricopeptide (TPR) repeat protein
MTLHPLIRIILLGLAVVLASCSFTTQFGDKLLPDAQYNTLIVKADAAIEDGQWAKATELYEQAVQLKPENWELKLKQAKAYQLDGKLAQAFNTYQLIVDAKNVVKEATFKAAKESQVKLGFKIEAPVSQEMALKDAPTIDIPSKENVTTDIPIGTDETLKENASKQKLSEDNPPIEKPAPVIEQTISSPEQAIANPEQADALVKAEGVLILNEVNAWVQAWTDQKLEAYYAHYIDGFSGDMGNAKAWQLSRKNKILRAKQITISLSEVQILKLEKSVQVDFKQNYQSGDYQDVGRKTLEMTKVNGRWLITKELFK